jgi:hypothetical protein
MKKIKFVLAFSILLLLSVSCSSKEALQPFPYGKFDFRSYNIAGELVGDGSLYIRKGDSNYIEGNWSIRNVRNCVVCGPQFGGGYLNGRIENDSMYINLNPDNPENYVELAAELQDNKLIGDWRWFKLIVDSNRGTFVAVKQ